MAISTLDQYIASAKQKLPWVKTVSRVSVAVQPFSVFDIAGNPGAGTLAIGNTASGVVHTNSGVNGYPVFNTFGGGATGYLSKVEFGSTVACRIALYDRIFSAGAYAFNANVILAGQPSYTSRIPGGTDYKGLEIWVEQVTLATGNQAVTVTYCVDEKTQALTKRGWLFYNELTTDDMILSYNVEENKTKWEKIKEIFIKKNYSGDMMTLGGRELNFITTPNHRWIVESRVKNEGQIANKKVFTSETLPKHDGFLLRGALHKTPLEKTYSDDLVTLVAWYYTEGCLHQDEKGITLCQSNAINPDKVNNIRDTLISFGAEFSEAVPYCSERLKGKKGNIRRIGISMLEKTKDNGRCTVWNLRGTKVDEILSLAPSKEKIPTMEFLTALTQKQLELFIDISIQADGNSDGIFYQHNSKRMDAFMTAAVLCGYSPSLDKTGTTCCIRKTQGIGTAKLYLGKLKRERYSVDNIIVWCPVTESGHWVARRDGKTIITGNTKEDGITTGRTTGAVGIGAAPTIGRMWRLPLQAGDCGVAKIESVTGTVATVGTFNIHVMRPLWMGRVPSVGSGDNHDFLKTGLVQVFQNTCLFPVIFADATATGIPEMNIEIANA